MDIGLGVPQAGHFADTNLTCSMARWAEATGFASLWAFDRLLSPTAPRTPYPASPDGRLPAGQATMLDPIVVLSAVAAVTERIRVGTSVLVAPWYPPMLLARSLASLDQLSGGRLIAGLGIGWSIDEYEAVGAPMAGRGNRLEEILEVMHAAWNFDVVEYQTSRETIAPCVVGLRPVQRPRPPIILAAYTPAGFERIARRADGWMPTGIPADMVHTIWNGILETAERYGRDAGAMRLVERANVKFTTEHLGSDRPDYIGTVTQIRDDIQRARDNGTDELIIELQDTTECPEEFRDLAIELSGLVPALA